MIGRERDRRDKEVLLCVAVKGRMYFSLVCRMAGPCLISNTPGPLLETGVGGLIEAKLLVTCVQNFSSENHSEQLKPPESGLFRVARCSGRQLGS